MRTSHRRPEVEATLTTTPTTTTNETVVEKPAPEPAENGSEGTDGSEGTERQVCSEPYKTRSGRASQAPARLAPARLIHEM